MKNSLEKIIFNIGKQLNDKISTPIVVGGWAINLLGFSRNTLDFDFMIFEDEFEIVVGIMKDLHYTIMVQTTMYARFHSIIDKEMPYIDCLFANKDTYTKLVNSGKKSELFGSQFILPDVLHIIAMKLHALKHGDKNRWAKDYNDIVSLIEIHNIEISDQSDFKELCDRYGSESIYKRIINGIK